MKLRRRDIEIFSLSFLDVICCAFGAVILLFVLSKFAEPLIVEAARADLSQERERLEAELQKIRGETVVVNRDLTVKIEQLSREKKWLARLQGDLSDVSGEFASSKQYAEVQNIIEEQLARAVQELTEEMKRLQRQMPRKAIQPSVGGIPVDSEYIIFIIDTSSSMQRNAWGMVQKKLAETLNVYPRVKGIQIMNDMGTYMFSQYRGKWIPDTPGRRRAIVSNLNVWRSFSNSSPVEGIMAAIRTFYSRDKKISIYVFGDEFTGSAIQPVINQVDRMNRMTRDGSRRVRIHAVGFPVLLQDRFGPGNTGERFATLMRALCHRNGGTFVGLNSLRY